MADSTQTITGQVFNLLRRERNDYLVAAGLILAVLMFLIPLPTVLLDLLMILNLLLSILIVLTVLSTRRALEFSIFPTLLLITTLFGLALNVSSTRLILTRGSGFDGQIVRAFATFVVGSSGQEGLVVGSIIFVIIIAVQFVVITKGATRVAEVAARFTLDSLPGKQMAIEAEYNSGAISEEEATRKKSELQRESDFYGAMDGASKFVSGNVKIGIFITAVNIIAGLIIGTVIRSEPVAQALGNYISLSIGDGLVSQFPALFVSTATGLIVTRAISEQSFGRDVHVQFTRFGRIYLVAAVFLLILAVIPGFPWYLLLPLAGLIGFLGFRLSAKEQRVKKQAGQPKAAEKESDKDISPIVPVDMISLEIGYALVPLVDSGSSGELLERITRIRREVVMEMGVVIPMVHIIDNLRLEPNQYCIKIKGNEIGSGKIRLGRYMAINSGIADKEIAGERCLDPAFGLPAVWINEEQRENAEQLGYTVVDSPSIIATHLTEVARNNSGELIGRQEVQKMLDAMRENYNTVIDEALKNSSVGEIQKVLQGLLAERVSIRNLAPILESIADYSPVSRDVGTLVEKARQSLARQLSLQYADRDKKLSVLTIDPAIEQHVLDSVVENNNGVIVALQPDYYRRLVTTVADDINSVQKDGFQPVIWCSEAVRRHLRFTFARELPDLVILSAPEVVNDIKVEIIGRIALTE